MAGESPFAIANSLHKVVGRPPPVRGRRPRPPLTPCKKLVPLASSGTRAIGSSCLSTISMSLITLTCRDSSSLNSGGVVGLLTYGTRNPTDDDKGGKDGNNCVISARPSSISLLHETPPSIRIVSSQTSTPAFVRSDRMRRAQASPFLLAQDMNTRGFSAFGIARRCAHNTGRTPTGSCNQHSR